MTVCGQKLFCFECDVRLTWILGEWWWLKLTRFHAGRKSLGLSVRIEIDLFFVCVVDIDLISVWEIVLDLISFHGWQLIFFVYGVENDLILVS